MKRYGKAILAAVAVAVLSIAGVGLKGAGPVVPVMAAGDTYTVSVSSGYLALRTKPAFDSSNEIGKLYSGDTVTVQEYTSGGYWWVYSPKYDRCGYVNNDYLYSSGSSSSKSLGSYTVSVSSGYLALRTSPSYDASNEIGELYSGDTVEVREKSTDKYWWVYSPKYGCTGYVNRNYLIGAGSSSSYVSGTSYTVRVDAGYLALRSSMAFSSSNEIGRLYNGDTVKLQEKSGDTYWYVYSPKLDKYGYVNKKYLGGSTNAPSDYISKMTVSVSKGYLALRTRAAYDESNEIGELYSGDVVYVTEKGSKYYYVYSPKYDKYGYVNKSYLY